MDAVGLPVFALAFGRRRLRILEYHGVCDDACLGAPWLPTCFVARSRFDEQMRIVARRMRPLPLREAVRRLFDGTLPPRAACVTFDDGYANNLEVAHAILQRHGIPATIYLSTHYVESGTFFPFDCVRLGGRPGATYKESPIDACFQDISTWWPEVKARMTQEQVATLRPLRVAELREFDRELVDFGAHTHSHCILARESPERRRSEIERSIELVRDWTDVEKPSFSYPNGKAGDFDERDKQVLRNRGVPAAVSCLRGSNGRGADPLELRRYPVGLYHRSAAFRIEVSGLRTLLTRS